MGKLHELLAVRQGLVSTAVAIMQEATKTFKDKPQHFLGFVKKYEPFEEGTRDEEEEFQELVTTVNQKLVYVAGPIIQWLDAELQMAVTNQAAVSDIILDDGTVLATAVPGTYLLNLESHLKQVRAMIDNVPTLAPGIQWLPDTDRGPEIYIVGHPEEKFRTKKVPMSKIVVEATKEHRAEVRDWHEDIKVGKTVKTTWCGMLSPLQKSNLLGRNDELIRAVKKARQRANSVNVVDAHIGDAILGFILNGDKQTT